MKIMNPNWEDDLNTFRGEVIRELQVQARLLEDLPHAAAANRQSIVEEFTDRALRINESLIKKGRDLA